MKQSNKLMKQILTAAAGVLMLVMLNISSSKAQNAAFFQPLDTNGISHWTDTVCNLPVTLGITHYGGDSTTSYTIVPIPYNPYPYAGTNCTWPNTWNDDEYAACITLPFTFCIYSNSYTSVVAASNNFLAFQCALGGQYATWPNSPLPSTSIITTGDRTAICCPWEDLFPVANNATQYTCVKYDVYGVAPFRRFVVSWIDVDFYGCNALHTKNQVVLHEGENAIDMYIHDKPICTTWNGGNATEGIQNSTATAATTVTGRNGVQWSVTNPEGYRFIPNNSPYQTITWTGPMIIGPTNRDSIVAGASGDYICHVHYACGNVDAVDTFTVVVKDSISSWAATPDSCGNHTGTLTVTTSGVAPFTYAWSPSGQTGPTATGLGWGLYTVTVTDANGCWIDTVLMVDSVSSLSANGTIIQNVSCFGGSDGAIFVSASGVGPFTYAWTPTNSTATTVSNLSAGNYTCFVVNPNNLSCAAHVYLTVTEPPVLTVIASPYSPPFCSYLPTGADTANVGGGTMPYAYLWSNGSTDAINAALLTGTYIVTITDAHGCTQSSSSSVSIPFYLYITSCNDTGFCQGDSTQISVSVTGGYTPYAYAWNTFGANGNPTYVHPITTTNYVVTVTDAQGCTIVSTQINVHVDPTPNPVFLGEPIDGCIPLNVQFTDHSTCSQAIVKWKWNFGDGSNYSDSTSPLHTYYDAGIFNVSLTVTSVSGCFATLTDSAYINAWPLPTARFTIDPPITSLLSPEIHFYDRSQGADTVVYDFGDGTYATSRDVFHSYADTGTYWITQTVYNKFGCADTINGTVIITPYYTFYIPNAFTPGTNGINDVFQPYGTGIFEYTMEIFDRWGEKLYTSTDLSMPWDGMINGEIVLESTYLYYIRIKDYEKVAHEYYGKITVLR